MAGNPFRRKVEQEQLPQTKAEGATKAFDNALQSVGPPGMSNAIYYPALLLLNPFVRLCTAILSSQETSSHQDPTAAFTGQSGEYLDTESIQ